jgi:hypothetical protein
MSSRTPGGMRTQVEYHWRSVKKQVEAPWFLDSRHRKVVRMSALRTGRLYI